MRPSCEQLCESAYFKGYSQKLIDLGVVDDKFKKMAVGKAYSQEMFLLRSIYIPPDLKSLSGFLPQKNYDSERT